MSITSVACPAITAEPSNPGRAPDSSIFSLSSTTSTISSTIRPMLRSPSLNTNTDCRGFSVSRLLENGTSGISLPRYLRDRRAARNFDLVARNILEPRNKAQWHRELLLTASAEQQHRRAIG